MFVVSFNSHTSDNKKLSTLINEKSLFFFLSKVFADDFDLEFIFSSDIRTLLLQFQLKFETGEKYFI